MAAVIPVWREPYHIAPAANGRLDVSANASGRVTVVDARTQRRLAVLGVPHSHDVAVLDVH